MTIAQDWKIRTFVRENTPGMHCSYPISATGTQYKRGHIEDKQSGYGYQAI